jgi:hypothetical protein
MLTVQKGDTLWHIAKDATGSGANWKKIAEKNNIPTKNPTIYPGQKIDTDIDGNAEVEANKTSTPTIEYFGLQAGTDTSVFAVWKWDKANTENYQVKWHYHTGDEVWFIGNDSTTTDTQSIYSAPSNAKKVKFTVKPISKKNKVNGKETDYWTANWSTAMTYSFSDNPPTEPSVPTVEIKDYTLTASLNNLDVNGNQIEFQVVKDNEKVYKTGKATIKTGYASYSCTITPGSEFKVRCRAVRGSEYSEWTDYSDNYSTMPAAPSKITVCKAKSETSVYLEWAAAKAATNYEIEYTTKKEYFDGSDQTTTKSGVESTHFEITGLESGAEYFFRVRALNDNNGESAWTPIVSCVIGKTPAAPTTWSSTTTCMVGESLTLYWMHNTEDGSTQTKAEVEVIIGGVKSTHVIDSSSEEDDEKTMHYSVSTSGYAEGTKIQWRVRTQGVTKTYGEWSMEREVDIYTPPSLSISVTDVGGNVLETLTSFPMYIKGEAGPSTQNPVSYHMTITSTEAYETTDEVGNVKMVTAGQEVYSNHFDTDADLVAMLSANSVDLENNVTYKIKVTVSMDSGLTAEDESEFTVAWSDEYYEPNAEIGIDKETLTASIRPYCEDEFGNLIEGVTLSVYRREFDGSFTELVTGLANTNSTFITDPHPALDFARYRVVAKTDDTGAVSFCDIPGYPVGEKAVIIQWDEDWSSFDSSNEDSFEEPTWAGSMLKLPYNIDVSDDHKVDVSLVSYIGRKRPVSYYGTQLGETASWNVEIPKSDIETLYALRRLAIWTGDVYVREPSGSGYWANVSVSFSQKHKAVTIPVSLSITRVAGGA